MTRLGDNPDEALNIIGENIADDLSELLDTLDDNVNVHWA